MHAPLIIRPAKLTDSTGLADLCGQLGYPSSKETIETRIKQLLMDSATILLVAESQSGEVVGWIQGCINTYLMTGTFVELAGLVVHQSVRGQKIGEKLVAALENWTQIQEIDTISLRSNAIRTDAHRFYERLDYVKIKTSVILEKSSSKFRKES